MKTNSLYLFKKYNTVMVSGWLLAVGFLMLSVSGARAAWRWDAPTLNVSDSNNWIGGIADFHFYYTGTEITYNLGPLTVVAGDNPTYTNVDFSAVADPNTLSGYRLIGNGLTPTAFIGSIKSASTMQMSRAAGNVAAAGGNYTASNYGPDLIIPSVNFDAGSTVIYTGTYDARQMTLGTAISGVGIAAGTYVTGVNSTGAITISQPTTAASSGNYTVSGLRSFSKSLGNLTYSGETVVPKDFVYINTNNNNSQITNSGAGKLVFNDPDAKFIVTIGNAGDMSFSVGGTLQFKGNATFSVNYGLFTSSSYGGGQASNANAKNVNGNTNLMLNATVDVAGDFTKNGADNVRVRGGSINLHGGEFNMMEGSFQVETAGLLTAPRIQGVRAINVARPSLGIGIAYLYLNTTEENGAQADGVNLIDPNSTINLFTGGLALIGRGDGKITKQTSGDVNLQSGHSAIGFANSTYIKGYSLTMKSLNQLNGATVGFNNLTNNYTVTADTQGFIFVQNDSNILRSLVGTVSGTNYGATNIAILPWAVATTGQAAAYDGRGVDFVTYVSGSGKGFRQLAATEYRTGWTGNADDNVLITSASTVSVNTTVNALKVTGGNQTLAGNLNITSGALLLTTNVNFLGSGTISTGNNPLIFQSNNNTLGIESSNVILHNTITGTKVGMVIGYGNVYTRAAGDFGGTVLIQGGGQFQVINGNALTEANGVRVDAASKFLVDTASVRVASLAGTGYVLLNNNTYKLGVGGMSPFYQAGHVTVQSGGMVSPGDVSGPMQASALYFGKNITGVDFLDGSLLNLDLGADGLSDLLAVYTAEGDGNRNVSNPTLTLGDGTIIRLNFLDGFSAEIGDTWLLSTGFSNVTLGSVLLQGADGVTDLGRQFALDKFGNNLRLTALDAIPEPSTWALMVASAALLAILRRRR